MRHDVDVVIDFQVPRTKPGAKNVADNAEKQYTVLTTRLHDAGFKAVGKPGKRSGRILICVCAHPSTLKRLLQQERHTDLLSGIPISDSDTASVSSLSAITAAQKTRLICEYITHPSSHGGLGIAPEAPDWTMVRDIIPLHDKSFNAMSIPTWRKPIKSLLGLDQILDQIHRQFGDEVALYFSFLRVYTLFLLVPATMGLFLWFRSIHNSAYYSSLMVIWSTFFTEYWCIREKMLAQRWGTTNATRLEPPRYQFTDNEPWATQQLRYLTTTVIIASFSATFAAVLCGLFLLEGFVAHLYTGPFHEFAVLGATAMIVVIPISLGIYRTFVVPILLKWQNHRTQGEYNASLVQGTFVVNSVVAYWMLVLSVFVYNPFGEEVMQSIHDTFLGENATSSFVVSNSNSTLWAIDARGASDRLNPARTQDQLFAYNVTTQGFNTFAAIITPYAIRYALGYLSRLEQRRTNPKTSNQDGTKAEKKIESDDFKVTAELCSEIELPKLNLLNDYLELVTQFGYVTIWSSHWPLVPLIAIVNNLIKMRADMVKLTTHSRRSIPIRVESIGAWLNCLTIMTWLGALINVGSVYLHHNQDGLGIRDYLGRAIFVLLCASHGHLILKSFVGHVLNRVLVRKGNADRALREAYLSQLSTKQEERMHITPEILTDECNAFWTGDQGLAEVRAAVKDA